MLFCRETHAGFTKFFITLLFLILVCCFSFLPSVKAIVIGF
ncbi:hypothetical protein HMPREF3230_00762 [Gardnerella vaginalis]|uniref:Uncharacterized protein n=1 Tax=Gardnerella vaginalis TaxID=2702 RepID=A0A135Z607_GARVA|nr:hypothetical protein HMPREF3230_00762 [Gardnerella vaginalis]